MKIGKRKVYAAGAAVLISSVALAAWLLGGVEALLVVVLAVAVGGFALLAFVVLQVERRIRADLWSNRALMSHVDQLGQIMTETTQQALRVLQQENKQMVVDLERWLDRKLQRPGEQAEALLSAIKAGNTRLELEMKTRLQAVSRTNQTMTRLFKHAPAELDALLQVHRRVDLADPQPLMGGWALTPRGMLQAIEIVAEPRVSLVVECGSGTSTVFLARVLQQRGSGRLVALEHLTEYAERTHQALSHHGLLEFAEVRYAPLERTDVQGESFEWYALSTVSDLNDIDVLIVDGPPSTTGEKARYPAFPILRDRLSPSAVVLVDDAQRQDEKSIVDAWLEIDGLTERSSYTADIAVLQRVAR